MVPIPCAAATVAIAMLPLPRRPGPCDQGIPCPAPWTEVGPCGGAHLEQILKAGEGDDAGVI